MDLYALCVHFVSIEYIEYIEYIVIVSFSRLLSLASVPYELPVRS